MPTEAQVEAAARAFAKASWGSSIDWEPTDYLRNAISAALTAAEAAAWQPTTKPPHYHGTRVLLARDGEYLGVGWQCDEGWLKVIDGDLITEVEPTHWRPLPQPPGETE